MEESKVAKEIAKFETAHKKIAPQLKLYTNAAASKLSKTASGLYLTLIGDASDVLAESMAEARENGVTGNKFADFAKDPAFKDGLKVYNIACNQLEKAQTELKTFCDNAAKCSAELVKLQKDIDKDLKSRKSSSASKKDIEKLRKQVAGEITEVNKAAAAYGKLPPAQLTYLSKFQANVDKIMKQAPEAQKQKRDATLLPQMLVDRNLAKGLSQANGFAKKVKAHCDAAIDKAGTDIKLAMPELKAAAAEMAKLKKVNDDYDRAFKATAKQLKGTKDEAKVTKRVQTINKLATDAARTLRGVATTIKKAG
ncbi:hypothetical protein [Frigidibacter sp. ROC022]|uniref:hypothetical protein n=1 Tax=Frigidibacter sp. ROC022 TaxID=2971796 RepID=UPI00215AE2F6|nr:hypothetical protein [Frigidibacter sp. ROC022]MCR8723585.1 hypothetical protein [Frigidibacter sp. ROC022]